MKFSGELSPSIISTGIYVPDKILTNKDIEKFVDTSDEWIVERTGIRKRHILEEGRGSSDMGVEAARRALDKAGLKPVDIDMVIVATYTPDHTFPTTACLIQDKLGMRTVPSFDLGAACSGFVFALATASLYAVSGSFRRVLMIGTDSSSRVVNWEDRNTCVLFGDAAAACVIEAVPSVDGPGLKVRGVHMGCDGSGKDHLYQPAGGSLLPSTEETVREKLHSINMNGREVFKHATVRMAEASLAVLEECGVLPSEIDIMIPHQANERIIRSVQKRLGLPNDKVLVNIENYGNTVAASIGLALDEYLASGQPKKGFKALLPAFGAGFTWGAALIEA